MNLVFLVVLAYIFKIATFVSAKPPLQFTGPARVRIKRESDFVFEDLPLDEEQSSPKVDSTARLQEALSSILSLNDGELNALLMGKPIETVAENLSPKAIFLLRASRDRLQKLQSALTDGKVKKIQQDDFQIAKRRKKISRRKTKSDTMSNDEQYEGLAEADSLLSALADLTQHLEEQQKIADSNEAHSKSTQSHPKDKRHYHSRTAQKTHFSYWLKSEECPASPDGTSRIYCPSPRYDGEWMCIEESDLCDGHSHCPNHEDEDPHSCMFYKGLKSQLDILVGSFLHLSSRRS